MAENLIAPIDPGDDEFNDPDIDFDGYCNCGSLHTVCEMDSGICDCCGGMIPDEEYS